MNINVTDDNILVIPLKSFTNEYIVIMDYSKSVMGFALIKLNWVVIVILIIAIVIIVVWAAIAKRRRRH